MDIISLFLFFKFKRNQDFFIETAACRSEERPRLRVHGDDSARVWHPPAAELEVALGAEAAGMLALLYLKEGRIGGNDLPFCSYRKNLVLVAGLGGRGA